VEAKGQSTLELKQPQVTEPEKLHVDSVSENEATSVPQYVFNIYYPAKDEIVVELGAYTYYPIKKQITKETSRKVIRDDGVGDM